MTVYKDLESDLESDESSIYTSRFKSLLTAYVGSI